MMTKQNMIKFLAKKNIIYILLFPAFLNGFGYIYEDFEYGVETYFQEKCVYITKYNGNKENVIIPSQIKGYRVGYIFKSAFSNHSEIKSIKIPSFVKLLYEWGYGTWDKKENMFFDGCNNIEYVIAPSDFVFAFKDSFSSLKKYEISQGETNVSDFSYYTGNNNLKIIIPDSVTCISNNAFKNCTWLLDSNINFPSSITCISDYAFYGCSNLENIKLPDCEIGQWAFSGCEKLQSVFSINGIAEIGESAFSNCYSLKAFSFSKDIKEIKHNTFRNCAFEGNLKLPHTLVSIGDYAFYGCRNIEKIILPNGLKSIGGYAFAYCEWLYDIKIPDNVTSIGIGAFYNCTELATLKLPSGLEKLNDLGLRTTSVNEINIPDNVTIIGSKAFYQCTWLNEISFPPNLLEIGKEAFSGCTNLNDFVLPDSLSKIGDLAFNDCPNLLNVIIPKNTSSIGKNLFNRCWLKSLIIYGDIERITQANFADVGSVETLKILGNTKYIDSKAFQSFSNLSDIELPNTLLSIGFQAFGYCDKLKQIVIPSSVKNIEDNAFLASVVTSLYFEGKPPHGKNGNKLEYLGTRNNATIYAWMENGWDNLDTFAGCKVVLRSINSPIFLCDGSLGKDEFNNNCKITFNNIPSDAEIHYTTDDSLPTYDSPKYIDGITISATTTIKARYFCQNHPYSSISEKTFTKLPNQVHVENATGEGVYNIGETVMLHASLPNEEYIFDYWDVKGILVENIYENPLKFIMPDNDVIATAVLKQKSYSLNVTNGIGSGLYHKGDIVSVSANNYNDIVFSYWKQKDNDDYVSFQNPLQFVMPNTNCEILPVYKFNLSIKPGWNLLSIPFILNEKSQKLFENYILFRISEQTNSYIQVSKIEPHVGFWLFSKKDSFILQLEGMLDNDELLMLKNKSWHLIGTIPNNSYQFTDIYIWEWSAKGFTKVINPSSMRLGKGYFLYIP